jgi:hypothetical protein
MRCTMVWTRCVGSADVGDFAQRNREDSSEHSIYASSRAGEEAFRGFAKGTNLPSYTRNTVTTVPPLISECTEAVMKRQRLMLDASEPCCKMEQAM